MTARMEFALVFTGRAGGAKSAANEVKQAMSAVSAETEKSSNLSGRRTAALEKEAVAARKAAEATRHLAAEERRAGETAGRNMERLVNSFAGIGTQAANRNGRASDIAAYGQELDRLRASFEPLFGAQQRYQQKLAEIAQAERTGAISASSAIDLRIRERNAYDALVNSMNRVPAARKAATEAMVARQTRTPDREADVAAYARELDRLQASLDPLFAAQQRYQQKLADIAQAERTGAISASAAIDLRIREKNAYDALVNSMNRVPAARKAVAEAMVARQTRTPDREADIMAFFDQRDAARAKHDPRFAVLTAYREKLAEIRKDLRAGAIDQDVATAAIQRHRQAALASVAALRGRDMPGSDRNAQFRRQNLTYQLFDIGQSTALGMPLGMVAMQQLPQIIQLYTGQGGMNAALKDFSSLSSAAARAVTPLTVGIGALAAITATGAIAYNGYLRSTKEVETAAAGLGRAVAGSAAEMEKAAQAGAAAAGISVRTARSMEAQFLRTGRIGSEHYEDLIGLSKDFAATIGLDTAAAGEALAKMFADPAEAAQTLYRQYGLIDAATARQATNLARQNRQSEAQAVLLDALPARLASAEQATTALGRAWEWVGTKASNTLDAIGKGLDAAISGDDRVQGAALTEAIREGQARLDETRRTGGTLLDRLFGTGDRRAANIQSDLDTLYMMRNRELEAEERRRQAEQSRQNGAAALSIAEGSGANANALREQTLRNEIEALPRGSQAEGLDDFQKGLIGADIEARSRMLDALINKQARLTELDRLDIQISNERNPILRAELEARRTRLEMADQEVSAETISTEAARARNRVIEETIATASANAAEMSGEVEIRSRLAAQVGAGTLTSSDANRLLQEELTLRPLIAAAAAAEGAEKERLSAVIAGLRNGYAGLAEQEKRMSAMAYLQTQSERLEKLQLETNLIGLNEDARRRAIALLEVEQEIRRRGLDTDGDLARQMREQADAAAVLNAQLDKQTRAWDAVRSAGENTIDTLLDRFLEGDFKGAFLDIGKEWSKTLLHLGVGNPLKNAALNANHETLDDLGGLGGMFSKLVGGGVSAGSMSVTAASVSVNGGVPGVGNLLSGANDNFRQNTTLGDLLGLKAANQNLPGVGSALGFVGNYRSGVDARLTDILDTAARQFGGYKVDAMSGFRPGDRRFHGKGLATDIQLTDLASGKLLGNYQDAGSFAAYERFAQTARAVQMAKYPELADKFRWGGYFSGGKGKYGALDTMHFDLAGAGMGGGSWESGLTSAQRSLWPGVESKGMAAVSALDKLAGKSATAAQGLGSLGTGFDAFGKTLTGFFPSAPSGGSSGGIGGFFSRLFGGLSGYGSSILSSSSMFANAWSLGGIGLYAKGGIATEPSIFGEAGAEAAVPLPDGRSIPVTLDIRGVNRMRPVETVPLPRAAYAPVAANGNAGGSNGGITQHIHNYVGAQVSSEESDDGRGGKRNDIIIEEKVGQAISKSGSAANRALKQGFNVTPKLIRR
ncbi:phage tail length tape measure family protein [Shinella sp.]|uniref:phage tail length tape measure family protein n=1 Tax=Shinella sp. TaxID=1870904 RepID=UPI0025891EA2|nr:phage tail length tape measure family protein [Shinella sp.]MCW5711262.1 phage tail length tape measure family protein [Shinella sp.]